MKYILYIVVSLIWFPIAVVSLPLVLVAAAIRATTKRLVSWVKLYALRNLNGR